MALSEGQLAEIEELTSRWERERIGPILMRRMLVSLVAEVRRLYYIIGTAALSPDQRRVWDLRQQGYTYRAIAEQMGIYPEKVSAIHKRAEYRLRRMERRSRVSAGGACKEDA